MKRHGGRCTLRPWGRWPNWPTSQCPSQYIPYVSQNSNTFVITNAWFSMSFHEFHDFPRFFNFMVYVDFTVTFYTILSHFIAKKWASLWIQSTDWQPQSGLDSTIGEILPARPGWGHYCSTSSPCCANDVWEQHWSLDSDELKPQKERPTLPSSGRAGARS